MITRTPTLFAIILSAGIAFTVGSPALAKDRDNKGFGQASVSSGGDTKSTRRLGRRISNGAPGIFGANLADPGKLKASPASFGNGTGSTTAPIGNGTGSSAPRFGNGAGSGNRPPPVLTVPPGFGSGNAANPNIIDEPTVSIDQLGHQLQKR